MPIETLNPRNSADVGAVAELHLQYLPESPVVQFGDTFLRHFYYRTLVEDDLIRVLVCRADGRIVGFISFTHRPLDFMGVGLRKHFLHLCAILGWQILKKPATLVRMGSMLGIMRARSKERRQEPGGLGEALSMAVLPEYQNHIDAGARMRLAPLLFLRAAQELKAIGINRIQLNVQPSNRAANLFYTAMGCSFEKVEFAQFVVHRYTYRINETEETNG